MNRLVSAATAALSLLAVSAWANSQPYAGQETRPIAALSGQDIDDLLNGRGWGLALPAELNGYPGPVHVLDLADALHLSDDQRAQVQAVYDAMKARAVALGEDYVAAERALNDLFEGGDATAAQVADLTGAAAAIRGQLRAVHLSAHLEMPAILNPHQKTMYDQMRGYAGGQDRSGHGGHSHD